MFTSKQEDWGGRTVPPPTVPSSIEGIVQLMYKSLWVGPVASIRVRQLELAMFWAGSCQVDIKSKVYFKFLSFDRNMLGAIYYIQ